MQIPPFFTCEHGHCKFSKRIWGGDGKGVVVPNSNMATNTAAIKMSSKKATKKAAKIVSSTAGNIEDFMLGNVKVNASRDSGTPMPVIFETDENGRVNVVMTAGCPPDTIGYNMNRAAQRERKSVMVANLRRKLAAKSKA